MTQRQEKLITEKIIRPMVKKLLKEIKEPEEFALRNLQESLDKLSRVILSLSRSGLVSEAKEIRNLRDQLEETTIGKILAGK